MWHGTMVKVLGNKILVSLFHGEKYPGALQDVGFRDCPKEVAGKLSNIFPNVLYKPSDCREFVRGSFKRACLDIMGV